MTDKTDRYLNWLASEMFIAHLHIWRLFHLSNSSDCFTLWEEKQKRDGRVGSSVVISQNAPSPHLSAKSRAHAVYRLCFLMFCLLDA